MLLFTIILYYIILYHIVLYFIILYVIIFFILYDMILFYIISFYIIFPYLWYYIIYDMILCISPYIYEVMEACHFASLDSGDFQGLSQNKAAIGCSRSICSPSSHSQSHLGGRSMDGKFGRLFDAIWWDVADIAVWCSMICAPDLVCRYRCSWVCRTSVHTLGPFISIYIHSYPFMHFVWCLCVCVCLWAFVCTLQVHVIFHYVSIATWHLFIAVYSLPILTKRCRLIFISWYFLKQVGHSWGDILEYMGNSKTSIYLYMHIYHISVFFGTMDDYPTCVDWKSFFVTDS